MTEPHSAARRSRLNLFVAWAVILSGLGAIVWEVATHA